MTGFAESEQSKNIDTQLGAAGVIDRDWLESRVARMVDDDEAIDPAENLLFYGVDSIAVMELGAELSRAGITVSFAELAEVPTLEAWWALIRARLAT